MGGTQKAANNEARQGAIQQYVYAIADGNRMGAAMWVKMYDFTKEEQHTMNISAFKLRLEEDILSAARRAERVTEKTDVTEKDKLVAATEVLASLGDYPKMVKKVTERDVEAARKAEDFAAVWGGVIGPRTERES